MISTGYVVCEADYADAPRHIRSAMWRIFKSALSVRGGSAYQTGIFGDLELDRVVYSAAERAVISSELCAGMRDLGEAQDGELLDTAEQLADIRRFVLEVEAALKRAAKTASRLSTSLSDCAKERATQQAAQRAAAAAAIEVASPAHGSRRQRCGPTLRSEPQPATSRTV